MATFYQTEEKNITAKMMITALKDGTLIRPHSCELCGAPEKFSFITYASSGRMHKRTSIVAHHWNGYSNPLDVWFICQWCNRILSGERFYSGQVSKEEAIQIIKAKCAAAKNPTGKCKGHPLSGKPCSRNTYNNADYCKTHYKITQHFN